VLEEQPSAQKTPQQSQKTPQKSAVKTVPATGVTSSQNGGHQEQVVDEAKDLLPQTEISEASEGKKRSRQEFLEGQQEEPI
jgi:fido (protein-threonine AMPylation protein)